MKIMGIGDWGIGPIPNPQSPIPKKIFSLGFKLYNNIMLKNNK